MATSEGMRPLHPNHLKLLRVRGAIAGLVLAVAAFAADAALLRGTALPFGLVAAFGFALAIAAALALPPRRYRAWGFRMEEDELAIASGLLVRSHAIVPFGRVQHIDVLRGPLQRYFGLAALVLHTAGTRSAAVLLPGLEAEEAERMRDHIRGKIREDLA